MCNVSVGTVKDIETEEVSCLVSLGITCMDPELLVLLIYSPLSQVLVDSRKTRRLVWRFFHRHPQWHCRLGLVGRWKIGSMQELHASRAIIC